MTKTKNPISKQDLARTLGVSIATIGAWLQEGMPVHFQGKKGVASEYILEDVMAWVAAKNSPDESMQEAKLRKECAQASLAELELQKERGELIEITEVATLVAKEYSTIRAKLLGLPSKLSGIIYSLQSQKEVREVLDNAFREILEELSADASIVKSKEKKK
jgi:phage terminase Nu1 subunit (DNA packaging protein)